MSRSYKRVPVFKEVNKKRAKRQANKIVRQKIKKEDESTQYKKLFCSYDITDYRYWDTETTDDKWRRK